jgi:hypothetical protein
LYFARKRTDAASTGIKKSTRLLSQLLLSAPIAWHDEVQMR